MKYAKGVCWVDDTRIPFTDEGEDTTRGKYENKVQVGIMAERPNIKFVGSFDDSAKQGRFTPNLLVCDDMLNDGSVVKSSNNWSKKTTLQSPYFTDDKQEIQKDTSYGDKGTNSRYYDLDLWFDKMIEKL